jgi:hypothetical protein
MPPRIRLRKPRASPSSADPLKKFDLNIQDVLEDWGVSQALREVIANALDEQVLTKTRDIEIVKDKAGRWRIRDYGRGLKYEHLTQNENQEKLSRPELVIGKFGVGLKDALATFDRHKIGVLIRSKYGDITIRKSNKHGFEDLLTLHAVIAPASDPKLVGTEVILDGVKDTHMTVAKDFFLRFSGDKSLENTQYGQVLDKGKTKTARIYITGLRVAEEENFLFSYNITAITKTIKKALNRERTNVGRTAYTDRVKAILLECKDKHVAYLLVDDLQRFESGKLHDELTWIDVQVHACKLLNASKQVIFLTPAELIDATAMVDRAQKDGYTVVTIPDTVKEKIRGLKDLAGTPIRDLATYVEEWNDSFEFKFVKVNDLTKQERDVFKKTPAIFALIGGRPKVIKAVLISETMRVQTFAYHEAEGVWEPSTQRIIIKRNQLKNVQTYAGTLLHEAAHARSGATDVTEEFETALTELLGSVAKNSL